MSSFGDFVPLGDVQVPGFPASSLPPKLAEFVEFVAEESQVPVDLPGCLALSAISIAVARRIRIHPTGTDYSEPGNLYVAVALPSGSRKSAVFERVMEPISRAERDLAEAARGPVAQEYERIEQLRAQLQRIRTKAAKGGSPDTAEEGMRLAAEIAEASSKAPVLPRLVTDDVTPEALAMLLAQQDGRIAVASPEGGELFEIIRGRYSSNGRAHFGVYLKGHSGDALVVDRKRERFHVDRPALTIAVALQPSVLEGLRERELRDRGLLARFLYSVPPSNLGLRSWDPRATPRCILDAYGTTLAELLALPPEEARLEFGTDAREAYLALGATIESELGPSGALERIADWAGKMPGAVVRLAGLLHAATWSDAGGGFDQPVGRDTFDAACDLGLYFQAHAQIALGSMETDPEEEGARKVWRFIYRHMERFAGGAKKREIWQGVKGGRLTSIAELEPSLQLLIDHGYLARLGGNGGSRSETYAVNRAAIYHEDRCDARVGGNGGTVLRWSGEEEEDEDHHLRRPAPNAPGVAHA